MDREYLWVCICTVQIVDHCKNRDDIELVKDGKKRKKNVDGDEEEITLKVKLIDLMKQYL